MSIWRMDGIRPPISRVFLRLYVPVTVFVLFFDISLTVRRTDTNWTNCCSETLTKKKKTPANLLHIVTAESEKADLEIKASVTVDSRGFRSVV